MSEQQVGAGAGGDGTQQQSAGEQGKGAEQDKTFTQEQVDAIVKTKAERLLKQRLGDADVDELRRKAQEFDQLQESQKSELQKAADRADAAEKRAEEAESRLKQTTTRHAVSAAASKAGFIDPDDAFRFLDAEDIDFDKSGDPKNLDKLLKTLADSKPHLVRQGGTNGSGDGGPRGGTPKDSDMNQWIRQRAGR